MPATDSGQQKAQRVEVRVDGRVRFAQDCYDVQLGVEDSTVTLHAALQPTLVRATKQAPQRFDPDNDPRDGDEVIQKVHTGSVRTKPKQTAAPTPKESS